MADVVALVDDLFFQAKMLETARQVGVELKTVTTGDALLAAVHENNTQTSPSLLIVDLNAPGSHRGARAALCRRQPTPGDCLPFSRTGRTGRASSGGRMPADDAALEVHAEPCRDSLPGQVMNRRP